MKIKKSLLRKIIKEALEKADVLDFTRSGISDRERIKAYRILAKRFHPDRNRSEDATADFQKIEQIKKALEDGTYKEDKFFPNAEDLSGASSPGRRSDYNQSGDPEVARFIRFFNSINPGSVSNIFKAVERVPFLNLYGYHLLKRYNSNPSQALDLYKRAEDLLTSSNPNFDLSEISGLGFDDDYVRWKFKSMVYAKKGSNIQLINLGNILSHAEYTIYEFAKILQRTDEPDIREVQQYLNAIRNQITKYHNEMDQRERAMNGIHMYRNCIAWIDKIAENHGDALMQYNLIQTMKNSLGYHMFTYYGARPPR